MNPLIRRALILWRAWRARRRYGFYIRLLQAHIERAQKAHKPRAHLIKKLRNARHAQLRMEQGIRQ